jgi:hypothetical protein
MQKQKRIRRGDTVILKSGGLFFTVERVIKSRVVCFWKVRRSRESKGNRVQWQTIRQTIPARMLKIVKPLSKSKIRRFLRAS